MKASESSLDDAINDMPENVITNIMDRLPIQDAVRTSILSTNWRFKWTLLSQLVFDEKFFEYLNLKNIGKYYGKIISRLLLNLKGVVTAFVLYISDEVDDGDISHWLMFLSRIGVKKLTLTDNRFDQTKLPTHFFSCLELKHLNLEHCVLQPPPSFRGFPNLSSLGLSRVTFQNHKCGDFLAQCPLLEILIISDDEPRCEVKLVEITKLENLKILYLKLCLLDDMTLINVSSIFHHLSRLPKLQELTLDFRNCEFLAETGGKKKIATVFPSLKTLDLSYIDLSSDIMVSFVFGMIFSSPNLQTLDIWATYQNTVPPPAICSSEVDYSPMGQLQLQNVELRSISGLEAEISVIKTILACSPLLKKLVILTKFSLNSDAMLMFSKQLLKLHRASPIAEVDLY